MEIRATRPDQKKAYFFALLSILCWSTVASAFKISLRTLTYIELLIISAFVSTIVLFIIIMAQKKAASLKALKRDDILLSLFMGFLNPFLYYLCVFKSYSLLPAQQAQPLNLIWGIVIVIFSIPILKQKVKIHTFIAILISFMGVIIISTEGHLTFLKIKSPLGVALALGSSIFWSVYWLINTKDKQDPIIRLFLNFCFGTFFIILFFILFHPFRMPPIRGMIGATYVGLFEMGLTFYFWLKALKLSQTTAKVSILIYIMPFISLIFINLFVGEKILFSSIAGLVLIVGGIMLEQYDNLKVILKKNPKKRLPPGE
ncbi:MAG: DMT family transporter [Candidatus Aminicenantes bacterium]|nr:DMT family transporter [Candidatus Aminicenantes bacterium]